MDYFTPTLTFAGILVSSLGTLLVKHYLDRKNVVESSDFEVKFTLAEINEIHQRFLDLEGTTKVDRFLILKAENGKSNPRFASVIFEQYRDRALFIASLVYTKIVVDSFYAEMLKTAETHGLLRMTTATMPENSRLRGFYESEKVTHSNLYFLGSQEAELKSVSHRIIYYCTLATKREAVFTKAEELSLQMFVDFVKDVFDRRIPKEE